VLLCCSSCSHRCASSCTCCLNGCNKPGLRWLLGVLPGLRAALLQPLQPQVRLSVHFVGMMMLSSCRSVRVSGPLNTCTWSRRMLSSCCEWKSSRRCWDAAWLVRCAAAAPAATGACSSWQVPWPHLCLLRSL
jgi:hypothetical protein